MNTSVISPDGNPVISVWRAHDSTTCWYLYQTKTNHCAYEMKILDIHISMNILDFTEDLIIFSKPVRLAFVFF